ncbi:hypothetical protein D3C85_1023110 [compost metagenome]
MHAAAQHGHAQAVERAFGGDGRAVLAGDEARRGLVVAAAEIDHLEAFSGDRHGRHDAVDLLHPQGRDQPVEGLLDPGAAHLHVGAEGVADLDLEAGQAAVGFLVGEGRVAGFDANAQGFGVLGQDRAAGEQGEQAGDNLFSHGGEPRVLDFSGRGSDRHGRAVGPC